MKFNIIHIIICIFVFVGCTQQTVNNSVECFTIKESGSSLVYCSDTLKSKIQMEIIKGHYTVETKEVFAIVSNPKHLSLGYDSAWNLEKLENGLITHTSDSDGGDLEKWENSQWIILDKKKHTNYFAELPFLAAYYYCFSFPIEYYPITKGKYRITKSLWDKDREIKLNAMFEIN